MKTITFIFIVALFIQVVNAQKPSVNQYAVVDKKMLQMPDSLGATTDNIASFVKSNFKTSKEKVRAIFIWTATNISYDIDNMFAINFYAKTEEKVSKALTSKKGICENFAALFNDICLKSGVKSFVVEGYTKQNGFADYIPHAWCAALIDSAWFLFDPTWGSGFVSNAKFIPKINNAYCMADPAILIKSHMPFDFLWQFLYYPVTNQEFYEGRIQQNKSKPFFNYPDSIRMYEVLDSVERMLATASRIEKNGIKNSLIFDRLQHIKLALENDRRRKIIDAYNLSIVYCNGSVNDINDFINYRNKQFTPEKPDAAIQAMIDSSVNKLDKAKERLNEIKAADASTALVVAQQQKAIDNVGDRIKEQQEWLNLYFSKPKSKRKSMFYEKKTTLFGMPVN